MWRPHIVFVLLGLTTIGWACAGSGVRRFPLAEPRWVDQDTTPLATLPARYFSGEHADGLDHIALRPLSRALSVPVTEEAWNVNSLDEVPDSSWFQNRIGRHPLSPEEVARGACGDAPPLEASGAPWLVVGGKTDGDNPGFTIRAPDGQRYLLKLDGRLQPLRATSADTIGEKLYHAAGYHTPCNQVVFFHPDHLRLDSAATRSNEYGERVPLTSRDVRAILDAAWRRPDGHVRAMASRLLAGRPIGPFRYEGTRVDDPNDVVPHEKRRELRGSRLLAAWINHVDSREQNSLDLVVEEGGRRFVRHHLLDWGDSCGALWPWEAFSRRLGTGRSGYFDLDHVFVDFFTLGLVPRPWNDGRLATPSRTFGYFGTAHFVPSKWRPGYRNPAFIEMTLRDALWATRIIARFDDAHLRGVVTAARLDEPGLSTFLFDALRARRDLIVAEYFGRGSSLADFHVTAPDSQGPPAVCFTDLSVARGLTPAQSRRYEVRQRTGRQLDRDLDGRTIGVTADGRGCAPLAAIPATARTADGYLVLEIRTQSNMASSVRLHLYDLGYRGHRLVGIERAAP